MPEVNGNRYRTFGQGYAAEKAKGKDTSKADPEVKDTTEEHGEDSETGKGSRMMVTHKGHGKFETVSEDHDGKKTKDEHDSPEELHEHMKEHFGYEGSPDDEQEDNKGSESEEDEDGGMSALHSLLG